MPRLLIALTILIASLSPLAGASASATSASSTLGKSAPVYLALGDSLAVGAGASDPAETGYVPRVHDALREELTCGDGAGCPELQLINLAEGGATTESLIENQLPLALELLQERNGDDDPGNDVLVITLDIGGNDAVAGVFEPCAEQFTARCGSAVQETLTTIGTNLTQVVMLLRRAAGPDTRIAVMTYFNSLIGCDYSDVAENAEIVLNGVPGITPGLNGIIREVAERGDALVAEMFGKLGPDDLVGGVDCLHANDAGYEKIADTFTETLTRDEQ